MITRKVCQEKVVWTEIKFALETICQVVKAVGQLVWAGSELVSE